MTELGTAYISVVAETSGIPRAVQSALGQADKHATTAGTSMGSKMASALGGALKVGAGAAVAAGSAAIGTALVKGFQRLDAIDQAKGKLTALGNSTQTTAQVMDSALASVKGTAYGLGDAATIAASAIAAGIKPGQDLTKYLSNTADAAAIAGSSLGDMGAIFNQVQTGQAAYTDDLNQLADRGIPIYQWIGQAAGVAASDVKDMASKGQISSEVFFKAIDANVGGAAKIIGSSTVHGAIENVKAALGRLGAAAEKPFFGHLPGQLTSATGVIDKLTPKIGELATELDSKIFTEWGPKLKDAFETVKGSGALDDAKTVFEGLRGAVADIWPSLKQIATSLGEASAALGVGSWQLFLTALQTGTTVLQTLNPLLETTANLMRDHQGFVVAAVGAYAAFKTIPGLITPITGRIADMSTSLRNIGSVPVVAGMRSAFTDAADGADRFGRMAGTAAAAGSGLRAAGSGILGVFGGPAGLGMTAAIAGGTAWIASVQEQKRETQAYAGSLRDLAEEQKITGSLLMESRGAATDDVYKSLTSQVNDYRTAVDAGAEADAKWGNVATDMLGDVVFSWRGSSDDISFEMDRQAAAHQSAQRSLEKLDMTNADVAKALGGSAGDWDAFIAKLKATGEGSDQTVAKMQELRNTFTGQQDIARRVVPGISELSDAISVLGDKGASSSDKLNALKTAMDAMNPARNQVEAIAQYGEAIRKVASEAQGIDASAFKDGGLDAMSESGSKLSRTLADLADKSAQVASTGGDMNVVNSQNEASFQALADATGQPIAKIRELYDQLGGKAVNLAVSLAGAPETIKELALVKTAFEAQPDAKTIDIETGKLTPQTLDMLDQLQIKWEKSPDGKTITIDAKDNASAKIATVTTNMAVINALKANPTIDLNKSRFDAKDADARAALEGLDRTAVSPEANLVIDKLLQGKQVSMQELDILNRTTANPKADMEIAAIMAKIGIVNDGLDNAARTRTSYINIIAQTAATGQAPNANQSPEFGVPGMSSGGWTGPGGKYDPAGIVHADEYVLNKSARGGLERARPGALNYMNSTGRWPGYAEGGKVSGDDLKKLAQGVGASQPLTGAPYVWGGVNWGDCSGAMSAFARAAVGLDPFGGRFATSSEASQLQAMGFSLGHGISGDLRFGWYNGGPGGGHTAGTLPDGTNIEMGGSYGGGMLGGSVGAESSQFTDHAYLSMGPSWTDPGSDPGGFVVRPDGTLEYREAGSRSSAGSGTSKTSLSTRLGTAAGAFVEGQIASMLSVLSVNDSPGVLAAVGEYESQVKSNSGDKVDIEALKRSYEAAKVESDTKFEADKAALKADLDSAKIDQAGYDQKLADLTQNHNDTLAEAKQKLDEAINAANSANTAGRKGRVTDPGTAAPRPGEDSGVFDDGGVAYGAGLLGKNIIEPERVLSGRQTTAFEQMVATNFQAGIGTDQILAKLDQILTALTTAPRGTVNYNLPADRSVERVEKIENQRRLAAMAGR